MSIKIYKDVAANSIFIEDANGAQFLNSLQASVPIAAVTIIDLARQIDIVSNADHTIFIDENENPYTGTAIEVCNQLNAIFQSSGTPTGNVPEITSPLIVNSVEGSVINYELTANYGVGYEWTNLPSGITTVEGNIRKLIGGSSLASGTYSPIMKAINYNGEDSENLTINVSNPPFSNTKSIKFNSPDFLESSLVSSMSTVIGRSGNGSGASDGWTISLYLKSGTHTGGAKQTIFYFGDSDHDNGGHVWIYYKGSEQAVYLEYGSKNNYIRIKTPNNSLSIGSWKNIIFTYDGGTTGSSSGDISNYYNRFKSVMDGITQITTFSNNNYGWSGSIDSDILRIGRRASGNDYLRNNAKVDEVALWSADEFLNISSIYNGGTPFDLSTLGSAPSNWWRMGDNDTYPNLLDSSGSVDLTMFNMTAGDIVNDTP